MTDYQLLIESNAARLSALVTKYLKGNYKLYGEVIILPLLPKRNRDLRNFADCYLFAQAVVKEKDDV